MRITWLAKQIAVTRIVVRDLTFIQNLGTAFKFWVLLHQAPEVRKFLIVRTII